MTFALSSSLKYIPIIYRGMIKKTSHMRPIYLKLLRVVEEVKSALNHGVHKKVVYMAMNKPWCHFNKKC